MGTMFTDVYNRFLGKITDDMYMELTPEDTIKDLRRLLIDALSSFEFPRQNIMDYTINTVLISEDEVTSEDFVIDTIWSKLPEDSNKPPQVLVEKSYFGVSLTPEEINIIALIMVHSWLQRQITSIENTRMKYSGSDFKMTSQANHLSKLLALQNDIWRQSHHMQRLYKRRKIESDGRYASNWSIFKGMSATDDN